MTRPLDDQAYRHAVLSAARFAEVPLPAQPRLAPWLAVIDLGDDRVQLRSAESAHTLTHPLLVRVFRRIQPLLDGCAPVPAIISAAGGDVLPTTVTFVLQLLAGKGLLQEGGSPAAARDAVRVAVCGTGPLARAVGAALDAGGVCTWRGEWSPERNETLPPGDLLVACGASAAFDFFDAVNRACLAGGRRWLRVSIWGPSGELGPTVVPRQTACYTCLELRRRTHEPDLDGYLAFRAQATMHDDAGAENGPSPFMTLLAAHAALEAQRLLTGADAPVTVGRYIELRASTPATHAHDVLKVPRCPSCDARAAAPEAWDRGFASIAVEL